MKYIATFLLAAATTASAQELDGPAQTDPNPFCATLATIVYQPPKDLIHLATKGLEELPERQPSATMSPQQYNRELTLRITVGEDGLIHYVRFEQSSGNRRLDRAVRNWAFGLMFAPLDCGEAFEYHIMLPVVVSAHAGGA